MKVWFHNCDWISFDYFFLIQAVTYLNLLKHLNNDQGPHLIVCPASVLENWKRELTRWCPSLSIVLFHGSMRTTYSKELTSLGKAGLPPSFNVLIACYSLFERHRFVHPNCLFFEDLILYNLQWILSCFNFQSTTERWP